jgi:hypothetical protein
VTVPTHFKFVFRGVFVNTPEEWSFGCKFSRTNPGEADAGYDDIDQGAVDAALGTLLGNAYFHAGVKATDWRAYVIGTDGHMETNAPLLREFESGNPQGSSGNRQPPQIALVATLIGADKGPAHFGRLFLPGPAKAVSDDLRLNITDATGYADLVTQFLKDVSDAIDLEVLNQSACVNVSPSGGGGAGTIQEVDHVEVGRVYDTLRTRRRQLLEERYAAGHIDW